MLVLSNNPCEVSQQAESAVQTTASLLPSLGSGGFTFAEVRGKIKSSAKPPAVPASQDRQRSLALPSQQPLS